MAFKKFKILFMSRLSSFFLSAFSKNAIVVVFWCFIALGSITLLILAFLYQRDRFKRFAVISRGRKQSLLKVTNAMIYFPEAAQETNDEKDDADVLIPKSMIDSRKADELISDKMAKNLVTRVGCVESFGKKRGIVNIGELSRKFKSGERIDINRLKAVGLISYDVACVKVLAGGILDKPLFIMANTFSKTAVKMIALMGGEAVKSNTKRAKMPKEMDG